MEAPETGLKVRRRPCIGEENKQGQLRLVIQGTDWQFDVNLNNSNNLVDSFKDFRYNFNQITSVDTVTLSDNKFCLSELTIATHSHAINLLLTRPRGEIKPSKKSSNWPVVWWDGSTFGSEDDEVNFERQFILPKSIETLVQSNTELGLMGKQANSEAISSRFAPVLHCDVGELEEKYGLHFRSRFKLI